MRMHDQCCSAVGKKDTTGTPIMFKPLPFNSVSLFFGGLIVWVSMKLKGKETGGPTKQSIEKWYTFKGCLGTSHFCQVTKQREEESGIRRWRKKREMDSLTQRFWEMLQSLRACDLLCVGSHLSSFYSSRCCGHLWPGQSLQSSWCCSLWPGRFWLLGLCVYTGKKRHHRGDSENQNSEIILPRMITKHGWFQLKLHVCIMPQS